MGGEEILKKKIIVLMIFVSLIAIGAVSAADNNTEDINIVNVASEDVVSITNNGNIFAVDNKTNSEIGATDDNKLDTSLGTFTDLANEIAKAGDELVLTKNYIYNDNIDSSYSSGINIYKKIFINGNGFTIDGNYGATAFIISSNNIILKDCIFLNCFSNDRGGAIYWSGNNGSLFNCNFTNCKVDANHSVGYGGAVCWWGLNGFLSNCNFINCSSNTDGGAVYWPGSYGSLFNCNFTNCIVSANSLGYGGAICWYGDYGSLFNCNFTNCYIPSKAPLSFGGAIYWYGNCGFLGHCVFLKCFFDDEGGAIYWNGERGKIDNCIFISCGSIISRSGGAIFWNGLKGILSNSNFINCSSGVCGIVYWKKNNGSLFNCNFTNCKVSTTGLSFGNGGAVYWSGDNGSLFNCNFVNCSSSSAGDPYGGAVCWSGSNGVLYTCRFVNCSSLSSNSYGGAVYWQSSYGFLFNCSFVNCSSKIGSAIYWKGVNGTLMNVVFENCKSKMGDYAFEWSGDNGHVVNCTHLNGFLSKYTNSYKILNRSYIIFDNVPEINFNETFMFKISLISGATGNLSVFVDDIYIKNALFGETCELEGLTTGIHIIKAIYDGDGNYARCENTTVIKVNKLNTKINVSNIKTKAKEVIIDVLLEENVSGNIKITVNNKEYVKAISNNQVRFYIRDLPAGDYNYTVTYSGDEIFNSSVITNNILVQIRNADIKITSNNITTVESLDVEYKITSGTTGMLEVYSNNVLLQQVSVGSKINLGKFFEGKYQIKVIYRSDGYYEECEDVVNIEVKKLMSNLTISIDDIYVGETANVNYIISNGTTGTLSLYLDDCPVKAIIVGSKLSISNLFAGNYHVKLIYGGDYIYEKCESLYEFTVKDVPLISFQDYYTINLGETKNIDIHVTDSKGNSINGGNVYLNDMSSPLNNGHALFTVTSKNIGVESYKVSYYPSQNIYSSVIIDNAFSTLTVSSTKLTTETVNALVGNKFAVKYTLTDALGKNVLDNGTFIVNGKTYYNLDNLPSPKKQGTYYYEVIFKSSTKDYFDSTTTLKIICKQQTKITVKSVTGYEGKKIKVTAIVKDGLGNKIKKGIVKFKIKGKTYKTNVKNGKAIVTIKVPTAKKYKTVTQSSGNKRTEITYYKSVYNCKATFMGYKQYPSRSTNFKVTSKDDPYYYSYYVTKKKTSSSSSSQKKSTYTYKFNVPHAHATVEVRVYTGSNYNNYSTGTNWLGNGAVAITETIKTVHEVELYVTYYDKGFKTEVYKGKSVILKS